MAKRIITPHKGGRSERMEVRLTPDEKERLRAIAKALKLNIPDYIVRCVTEDEKRQADAE